MLWRNVLAERVVVDHNFSSPQSDWLIHSYDYFLRNEIWSMKNRYLCLVAHLKIQTEQTKVNSNLFDI